MRVSKGWAATLASFVVLAGTVFAATSSGAGAAVTISPAITGDPNAANGSIAFYDSSGNQITGGSNLSHLFDYASASSPGRPETTKATIYLAFPDHNQTDSVNWFFSQATTPTAFPIASAPAPVNSFTNPTVKAAAADADLMSLLSSTTLDTTAGYAGIIQVRMKDTGPTVPVVDAPFWATDIFFDSTAGTWQQVFPTPPAPKISSSFSSITPSPVSPAAHGSTVSLISTLTAADSSHPDGTVHLFDGATDRGAATFTAGSGAVSATDTPADGPHSYTFKFTPTDTTTYNTATSSALAYTVNGVTATTTTLGVTPTTSAALGASVTLTATISPTNAAGSVQFMDGNNALGAPATVSSGVASLSTSALSVGTHSLKAVLTPTDSNAFAGSTSAVASYSITKIATSTSLAVAPASAVVSGASLTFTATVTPSSVAGSVQFSDGSTALGSPQTVTAGAASLSTSALTVGAHAIKATFTPSDSTTATGSASAPTTVTISAGPVTPTIALSSMPSPAVAGSPITIKATFTPNSAVGTVQFADGATPIGSPQTVSQGVASLTTSALTAGPHQITAAFTAGSSAFNDTLSSTYALTVIAPPTATTTTLDVQPGGPAAYGTVETLTATLNDNTAAGSVKFFDGSTQLGSTVTVTNGVATMTTTLSTGTHSVTAQFVPSDPIAFAGSTSAAQTYVVNKAPATSTSTTLVSDPAAIASVGTPVSLTATVALGSPANGRTAAAGAVEFFDGTTSLGSAPVSAGESAITTSALTEGDHTLTATFTPTDPTDFVASTSADLALRIKPAAVLDQVMVDGQVAGDGVTLKAGDEVTLSASGFVPGESVDVVLRSTPLVLATVVADSSGNVTVTVTLPTSLAAGNHTLTLTGSTDAPAFAFTVAAPTPPNPGTNDPGADNSGTDAGSGSGALADTGAHVVAPIGSGLLLVIVGVGLVVLNRRRAA